METAWYALSSDGLLSPLVLLVPSLLLMAFWNVRVLSTRGFYVAEYAMMLGYAVHVDYVVFIGGLQDAAGPLDTSMPWFVRVLCYAAVLALTTYAGAGMARRTDWKHKMDLPRGLPYLKERWRERKRK